MPATAPPVEPPMSADPFPALTERRAAEAAGWRCQYRAAASGRRCMKPSRHVESIDLDAPPEVANLRVVCARHARPTDGT